MTTNEATINDADGDDVSFSENAPVTGQGRMDAAWGLSLIHI